MAEQSWHDEQINSVIIVKFMIEFDKFEKTAKKIFQNQIKEVEHKYKSILYFYYGCTIGNEWKINYDQRSIELVSQRKYDDSEMFKTLSLDKINKFLRKENILQCFNIKINSLQTKMLEFTFYDSCEKLIKMRNCLAHSINKTNFNDRDIIELLSDKKIEEKMYDWVDKSVSVNDLTTLSKNIFSNMIYMRVLLNELSKQVEANLNNKEITY